MEKDDIENLKEVQVKLRQEKVKGKTLHGPFYRELEQQGRSITDCSLCMRKVGFSARVEGVAIAAQDGVLLTRGYRSRILKAGINSMCRNGCGKRETMFHILAAFNTHKFTIYKNRHDLIVIEVANMVMKKFGIGGSLKMEENKILVESAVMGIKITVDLSVMTD